MLCAWQGKSLRILAVLIVFATVSGGCGTDVPRREVWAVSDDDFVGPPAHDEEFNSFRRREVVLTFPEDSLHGVAELGARVSLWREPDVPFVGVELQVGEPVDEAVVLNDPPRVMNAAAGDFALTPPLDCDGGCVLEIPVTVERTPGGAFWSFALVVRYERSPPSAARQIEVDIVDP